MKIKSNWTDAVEIDIKGIKYSFNPGQIKEIPDDFDMDKLRHFEVVDGKSIKKEKKKEETDLDINQDGKVDSKDAALAGKVLASRRYKK